MHWFYIRAATAEIFFEFPTAYWFGQSVVPPPKDLDNGHAPVHDDDCCDDVAADVVADGRQPDYAVFEWRH